MIKCGCWNCHHVVDDVVFGAGPWECPRCKGLSLDKLENTGPGPAQPVLTLIKGGKSCP